MDQAKTVTATFSRASHALTVSKAGTGSGTVTSPTGITCGNDCTESYLSGTRVTLIASAASGSVFAGWGGACSGTAATCTLTVDQAKTVTASFNRLPYRLTVRKAGSGSGTVTSNPTGITCGSDCTENYLSGTPVTLTATARSSDSMFTGWQGDCSGTSRTCQVTLTQARTVTARFTKGYVLTVRKAGYGSGTVTSSPSGINCGSDCDHFYPPSTKVKLTPEASSGSIFAGWSGACSGKTPCQVTMSAARTVTATFNWRIKIKAQTFEEPESLVPLENRPETGNESESAIAPLP
jgi:uncharacterized repeat protein (TIGR02543 family)